MTVIEIAIKALRLAAKCPTKVYDGEGMDGAEYHKEVPGAKEIRRSAREAIAVLTAEPSPVPPDRERNTGLVRDAESYLRQTGQTVYADAVASLLRQPSPAEVEAMAKRLDAFAKWAPVAEEAAAFLRRLAPPIPEEPKP